MPTLQPPTERCCRKLPDRNGNANACGTSIPDLPPRILDLWSARIIEPQTGVANPQPCATMPPMSALPLADSVTPEEYLRAERGAETKSDYLNGIVVTAMAGAKHRHNLVAGNILRHLGNALADRPCIVYGSDMKVRVEKANIFRYPDISALCGPIDFHDDNEDAYGNPQFIVEVLSPSTRGIDKHEKFAEYRLIETFTEYLLVEPERIEAELHRKGPDGRWTRATFTEPDDLIALESIGVTLRLKSLYEKVVFPDGGSR